jgi:hypothetical protein
VGPANDRSDGARLALRDQVVAAVIVTALLGVNLYKAMTIPVTSAEAVVYSRYVAQSPLDGWMAPFDAQAGAVYPLLARMVKQVIGVSEIALRLPAVLGGLLFWVAMAALARRWFGTGWFGAGWMALAFFLAVVANPWMYAAFSTANGRSVGWGFLALGLARRNALALGIAVASDPAMALPAFAIAGASLWFGKTPFWRWVDDVLLPAALPAAFLLAPVVLSQGVAVRPSNQDVGIREVVKAIPGGGVGASRAIEPGITFYRRRFHLLDRMKPVPPDGPDGDFDYYVLLPEDGAIAAKYGLRLMRESGAVKLYARH